MTKRQQDVQDAFNKRIADEQKASNDAVAKAGFPVRRNTSFAPDVPQVNDLREAKAVLKRNLEGFTLSQRPLPPAPGKRERFKIPVLSQPQLPVAPQNNKH